MCDLNSEEQAVVDLVRTFVDREVKPVAQNLDHTDTYPEKLIEQMKAMGICGLAVPGPWGGRGRSRRRAMRQSPISSPVAG